MAKQIENNKGFLIIELTAREMMAFRDGHWGQCDLCEREAASGYLIASIDSFYCPDCYNLWNSTAIRYKPDMAEETRRFESYKAAFIDLGTWED